MIHYVLHLVFKLSGAFWSFTGRGLVDEYDQSKSIWIIIHYILLHNNTLEF